MRGAVRRSGSPHAGRAPKKARSAVDPVMNLPDPAGRAALRKAYDASTPWKHTIIPSLLSDDLLEAVVTEAETYGVRGEDGSLPGWGWEQKETDIYKIQQTPDLSSLDPEHLPEETLNALPYITKLKNALYSEEFRKFVRDVTGCGPLSGKKTDGSAGLYTKGSHLLLHDDSISTRVISYILYLPCSPLDAPESPHTVLAKNGKFTKGWDPKWGGSLELYPVADNAERGMPANKAISSLPAQWGQIIFFEVQPGLSYHSVEEVICADGRKRLGVSGWFHRPIEGEEGYGEYLDLDKQAALSSLAQITAAPSIPIVPYPTEPPVGLTPAHLRFLKPYISASYLLPATLDRLGGQFVAASEIVLHNFLAPDIAAKIKAETEGVDKRDFGDSKLIPPHSTGEGDGWVLQGPSSKHRYASLTTEPSKSTPTLQTVLTKVLPSEAFRAWLSVVSSLAPTGFRGEARRFRRGLDYTLAAGEERTGDVRLDAYLGLTWWADVPAGSKQEEQLLDHGGWECYLPSPDEGEDPETYQSTHAKKGGAAAPNGEAATASPKKPQQGSKEVKEAATEQPTGNHVENQTPVIADDDEDHANGSSHPEAAVSPVKGAVPVKLPSHNHHHRRSASPTKEGPKITMGGTELEFDPDQFSDGDFDTDESEAGDDDGPLLTQPVSFNKFLLVLRDPGVMRFVKYLSASAPGSRWDLGGEWEVGQMEEDSDEEEEEEEGADVEMAQAQQTA